ncbi:hypothetical protein DL546_005254 [Coniochaeta pulveracea]|uniref:Uncharacterized protein n=1 Tax=Coniochaeta pulveracea TaxID=177199 RepID=A0A420YNG0_9PEZI|nr:hypothetical protein DL546_005254 [Coniochaeta pulveracea]
MFSWAAAGRSDIFPFQVSPHRESHTWSLVTVAGLNDRLDRLCRAKAVSRPARVLKRCKLEVGERGFGSLSLSVPVPELSNLKEEIEHVCNCSLFELRPGSNGQKRGP